MRMKKAGLYADNEHEKEKEEEEQDEVRHITYSNNIDFVPHLSLTVCVLLTGGWHQARKVRWWCGGEDAAPSQEGEMIQK